MKMGYQNDEESGAPVAFAAEVLRKIGVILDSMNSLQTESLLPQGQIQHLRIMKANQIFTLATPLLPGKIQKEIRTKLERIQPKWKKNYKVWYMSYSSCGFIAWFDSETERQLNDIIINILDALQFEGFFMPKKTREENIER